MKKFSIFCLFLSLILKLSAALPLPEVKAIVNKDGIASILASINDRYLSENNFKKFRQKFNSEIAECAGFTHLVHITRPENLFNILKSGKLIPGGGSKKVIYGDPIGNHDAVFLRLLQVEGSFGNVLKATRNSLPILVFDPKSILDNAHYHASIGYPYGMFVKYDVHKGSFSVSAHCKDQEAFEKFCIAPNAKLENEIVIYEEVSLESIKKIIVKTGTKQSLIEELHKQNVAPPSGLEWNDLIIEMDPLLESVSKGGSFKSQWLRPYSSNSEDIVRYALHQRQMKGSEIINLLIREYPGLRLLYNQSAQVREGYTVKEHTLRVFNEYEMLKNQIDLNEFEFSEVSSNIDMLLKVGIALHDIGKPLGPKEEQHRHTVPILETALETWGFDAKEIRLAVALIGHDIIGDLIKPNSKKAVSEAFEELNQKAIDAGLDYRKFFTLQKLFYFSDAMSYPYLKANVFRCNESNRFTPINPKFEMLELGFLQAPVMDHLVH